MTRIEQQLQRCREGPGSKAGIDELISSLTDLRAELAHHFAEEEAGGCLEEAVAHTPRLGRKAAALEVYTTGDGASFAVTRRRC